MRIAHFVQRYPPALGGSEAYFARLSRACAAQGDEVTVFTTTAVDLEAFWSTRGATVRPGVELEDGVEVRRYRLWRCLEQRRILKLLSFIPHRSWQLWTTSCNPIAWGMWRDAGFLQQPFDIVHATAFPYGWCLASGLRLARRLKVPFLLTPFLHLGDPDNVHDRTRRAYTTPALLSLVQTASRVFVQTEVERSALIERGIPPEKLVLQGMGVDLEECTGGDRGRARSSWGVSADAVVVGHLANNSVEKGTVDLLRAVERAWQRGSNFELVLAGPEMPSFRSYWERCPIAARVRRLGVLDTREKRDFFAGIDIFAMPSRSDSFGITFLEAWANGVPNVAYRAGGVAGLIRDESDGLLARCDAVDELAERITRLATDKRLRWNLGAKGRQRALNEFRWADKLELVRGTYRDLVFSRSPLAKAGVAPEASG
jgi:glycosyltransferase involved in cell wall biosynthesis